MKMLSLQRRQERYRVIYVWKVLEGLVPNCGINVIPNSENTRLGRRFPILSASSKLRTQTFQDHGPKLFNSMPAKLRNLTRCPLDQFKMELDIYLSTVPDEPKLDGLVPSAQGRNSCYSNSLIDQARRSQMSGHRMTNHGVYAYSLFPSSK